MQHPSAAISITRCDLPGRLLAYDLGGDLRLRCVMSAGDYLQHVHIASRRRRITPSEDGEADNYVDGFRALKKIGYDKCVSFECGAERRSGGGCTGCLGAAPCAMGGGLKYGIV